MKKFLIFLFFLSVLPCQAQIINGTKLREWLSGYDRNEENRGLAEDQMNSAFAVAYIIGAADAYKAQNMVCTPVGITGRQLVAVTSKFVKDHPDTWNQSAALITLVALMDAFPCKK